LINGGTLSATGSVFVDNGERGLNASGGTLTITGNGS
jgi:hypothetical protein